MVVPTFESVPNSRMPKNTILRKHFTEFEHDLSNNHKNRDAFVSQKCGNSYKNRITKEC
ncbi:hypothetical protein LMANV2_590046 [Leptospira interrogans serovar Manilae]|uniref:Uncharacterized protein n=1 Tax=Leptospira interrogans serovar Manilae TaxID=214675 RepID=A0AAQ1SQ21_LEPIR|nr:hypothetical protein LMANV2_590046 [Leptospira interrogans serovar Manilae]